eukprot:19128-Pelagococcus_subviridis.AAC.1
MVTSEGRTRLALTSLELRPSRSVASTPRPIAGPSSAHVATAFAPSVPRTTPSAPGTSRKMVTSFASNSARKTELIFERGSEEGEAGAGGVNGVNDAIGVHLANGVVWDAVGHRTFRDGPRAPRGSRERVDRPRGALGRVHVVQRRVAHPFERLSHRVLPRARSRRGVDLIEDVFDQRGRDEPARARVGELPPAAPAFEVQVVAVVLEERQEVLRDRFSKRRQEWQHRGGR